MPTGIRDKVAIIGMGCTRFGERWDVGAEDLMVEAFEEALADAGIDRKEIQAAWLGTCFEEISVGKSALPLSITLRLPRIPVTRVENFCATGTEAFRGAYTRSRRAHATSRWPWGWRNSKTWATGDSPTWGPRRGA
jgi:Acetyl-CoA acetyltransferase